MTPALPKTFAGAIQSMTEAIALGATFEEVERTSVELLERLISGARCSITRLSADGKHLGRCYAPSMPSAYVSAVEGVPIGSGAGSCGTALCSDESVVARDVRKDSRWDQWRELADRFEIVACWSEPVLDGQGVARGAFSVYLTESRRPKERERRLVQTAALLVSLTLQRDDRERALRASEQRFRSLADQNPNAVCAFALDGRLLESNASSEGLFGEPGEALKGRNVFDLFSEESREPVREAFAKTARGAAQRLECWLLRASGDPVAAHASFLPIVENGEVAGVFLVARDISRRRQAEAALRESERSLSALLGNLPGLAYRCCADKSRTMELVSRGAKALTGYEPEALLSGEVDYGSIILAEDRAMVLAAVQAAVKRREVYTLRYRIQTASGERRWVWDQGLGVWSESGELLALEGFIADVTGQREAELAAQQSHERQQRVSEAVLAMAEGLGAAPGVDFLQALCARAAHALGADAVFLAERREGEHELARIRAGWHGGGPVEKRDYLLGRTPCRELADRPVAVLGRETLQRYPELERMGGTLWKGCVGARLTGSDGVDFGRLFAFFKEPVTDEAFAASVTQVFARGASAELERERSDSILKEQAALLEQATDAIWVENDVGRLTYWNQGARRLLGWASEEAIGREVRDFLVAEAEAYEAALEVVRREGSWTGELSLRGREGQLRVVEARWTFSERGAHGRSALLAIQTDVTEKRELERQFLRSQRLEGIGRIAGGVAHDLNNALAPILLTVGLLRMRESDPRRLEQLGGIESAAQRGAGMVKQLLSFARGVEGERKSVSVGELVGEAAGIVDNTFLKSVTLSCRVARALPTVMGDATQLHQVLLNLCVNARDAMPKGGSLEITAEACAVDATFAAGFGEARPGAYVRLGVNDTGEGMPPEVVERIFDPFFTTKPFGQGTGLGLSTCLAIVRSHGGFLRVDSVVGKGTRFEVYLPASAEEECRKGALSEPVAVGEERGKGERVLVVDDEKAVRETAAEALKTFGYEAETAASGAEAVKLLGRRRDAFAVAVVDMMMPVLDGASTIQVLRRIEPKLPVVACSGLLSLREDSLSSGAALFLAKPFTANELARAVRSALGA